MDRTSQHSSSTRASHNNHFIRRGGHNSEIHPTCYGTMRRSIFRRPRRNNNVRDITIQFHGNVNMQTALLITDAAGHFSPRHAARVPQSLGSRYSSQTSNVISTPFAANAAGVTGVQISESSRVGNINLQRPGSYVSFTGVQTPAAAARGSERPGYHQQTQNAGTSFTDFGGQNLGQGSSRFYSQVPGVGLDPFTHHGGFTGEYNPWEPGTSFIPQAYVDGLTTLQAPFLPTQDTQAAVPPYLGQQLPPQFPATAATNASTGEFDPPATLAHQQLSPPLWASTAANNAYNGEIVPDFLAAPISENYMDMLFQPLE